MNVRRKSLTSTFHVMSCAGPFSTVSTPMAFKLDLPDLGLPSEGPAGRPPGKGPPPVLTHFAPPASRALLELAVRFVPLVVAQYEIVLNCRHPFPSLQQVNTRGFSSHIETV